jgi:hypothetical protein
MRLDKKKKELRKKKTLFSQIKMPQIHQKRTNATQSGYGHYTVILSVMMFPSTRVISHLALPSIKK